MSTKGLIYDRLAPVWATLTDEQRLCWHFEAGKNPRLNQGGELYTENGWQYFVDINSALAVIDESLILETPPANNDAPPAVDIESQVWPIPSKPASGPSQKKPKPWLNVRHDIPAETAVTVTQGYDEFEGAHNIRAQTGRIQLVFEDHVEILTVDDPDPYVTTDKEHTPDPIHEVSSRAPRVRHVRVIETGESGAVSLQSPNGYYATTGGTNKFATINGRTAARRPDKPLGRIRIVNLTNGTIVKGTLTNPTGQ